MADEGHQATIDEPVGTESQPTTCDLTPDHPQAGVPEEGWSAPVMTEGETCEFAKLVVKRGGAETDIEFPLSPPAIIGRFDPAVGPIDVDLGTLPEGSYVSRKHAKIIREDGVWKIEDLGSSNGTFVLHDNFDRVEQSEIKDGDEIALGNARFVFHLQAGTE
jgi:hypothetical protein